MVIFTQHALLKLQQRNIKKNLVIKTLKKPNTTLSGNFGCKRKIGKSATEEISMKNLIFKKSKSKILIPA